MEAQSLKLFSGLEDKVKADYIGFLGDNYNVVQVLKSYKTESYKLDGLKAILRSPPKTVPTLFEILASFTDNSKKLDALSYCLSTYTTITEEDFQSLLLHFETERSKLKLIKLMKQKLISTSINVPTLLTMFSTEDHKMKIINYLSTKISANDIIEIVSMLNKQNNIVKFSNKHVPSKSRFISNEQMISILKKIGGNNMELLEKLVNEKYHFGESCLVEIYAIYKGDLFQNAVSALLMRLTNDKVILEQLKPKQAIVATCDDSDSDSEMEQDSEDEENNDIDSQSALRKYFPDPSVLKGEATIEIGKTKFSYFNGVSSDLGVKGLPTEQQSLIDAKNESLKRNEAKLCKKCHQSNYSYMLMPCNHVCLCSLCVRVVCAQNKQCPVCRTQIAKVQKVFHY